MILVLFSFGPLSNKIRQAAINPVSSQPAPSTPVVVNNAEVQMNAFHNKDVRENYYTFSAPSDWQVQSGTNPGSYNFTFSGGSGSIEQIDVPDNSTLELFILSQQEPKLKTTIPGYARTDYKNLTVNGNEAYTLVYDSSEDGGQFKNTRTYIAGPDQAIVITFHTSPEAMTSMQSFFTKLTESFNWENV
ncbi:MAG: hypothetical protein NTY09_06245 [bacterium]|nr:hypothetical protein [bacterium]